MLSKNLKQGSSINAIKPVRVLNRPAGSGAISGKRDSLMHYCAHDSENNDKYEENFSNLILRPIVFNVI